MVTINGIDTSPITDSYVGVMRKKADLALRMAKEERENAEWTRRHKLETSAATKLANLKHKNTMDEIKAKEQATANLIALRQAGGK